MSLELKNIEARKTELQGELKKVETQLVEVLSNVELLKQKKLTLVNSFFVFYGPKFVENFEFSNFLLFFIFVTIWNYFYLNLI